VGSVTANSRSGHILNEKFKKERTISEDNSFLLEAKSMQENWLIKLLSP